MVLVLIVAAICLFWFVAYFSPLAWRLRFDTNRRSEVSTNRILALTYDDGPSETLTPRLLDLLREKNAKATFFMLGRNVRRFPHIVDQVRREGHDIGCHSEDHLHAWTNLPWRCIEDINAGFQSLSPWIRPEGMFRPPYGKMTLPTFWAIWRRGSAIWWWTLDSLDSSKNLPTPAQVTESVHQEKGAIVLMHDFESTKERDEFVLQTTASLLDLAHREQMRVLTLNKLSQ